MRNGLRTESSFDAETYAMMDVAVSSKSTTALVSNFVNSCGCGRGRKILALASLVHWMRTRRLALASLVHRARTRRENENPRTCFARASDESENETRERAAAGLTGLTSSP